VRVLPLIEQLFVYGGDVCVARHGGCGAIWAAFIGVRSFVSGGA
jgi:hypothetical protein